MVLIRQMAPLSTADENTVDICVSNITFVKFAKITKQSGSFKDASDQIQETYQ